MSSTLDRYDRRTAGQIEVDGVAPTLAAAPLDLRDHVAAFVARTAGRWSRRGGHAGSSLPGLMAERISPGITSRLASQLDFIAVVSGTNGKTTTTHLVDHILRSRGRGVITNRSGANLNQSISTSMLDVASPTTAGRKTTAVLECDEFAMTALTKRIQPNVLVLTNLFRDQLDRYAEIDEIERRWALLLADLAHTVVIAPADDSRLAWLAGRAPGGCLLYGARTGAAGDDVELTHDAEDCPACGQPLIFDWHTIGQQGRYACHACGLTRPTPWLEFEVVESHGFDGQTIRFTAGGAPTNGTLSLSLPGLANAYNAAAAICAASVLGVGVDDAIAALSGVTNAWGRFETATIEGHRLILTLGKNPASVAELLRIAAASDISGVLFVMNDGFQDGRDVSWYWDVNPASLMRGTKCAIAGSRALDLALRLKYGMRGRSPTDRVELPRTFEDPMAALRWLLGGTSAGATLLAITTYTGLLQLRDALVASNVLERMPV